MVEIGDRNCVCILCLYSGFRRDVLTPGVCAKCSSKLELLGWPGHAVSALRNVGFWRVFGGVCCKVSAYKC